MVSDYTGAAALLSSLPDAEWLLADRGYDADWFREALITGISLPASLAASHAARPSNTTSADTNAAIGLRECSVASKIGDASQPAMTGAQRSSSRLSLSLQPSYSGYESGTYNTYDIDIYELAAKKNKKVQKSSNAATSPTRK